MKRLVRIFRTSCLEFKINGKDIYCKNLKYNNDTYHVATAKELNAIKFIANNNTKAGLKAKSILNLIN